MAAAVMLALALTGAATAADRAQLHTSAEAGYGRLILSFPDRLDLPAHKIAFENNVLAITFDAPISLPLPEIGSTLPDYFTTGRVDPDGRGVRFGLRGAVNLNSMEAGERLFIDLIPSSWRGLPPGLPPEIVAELSERRKAEAIAAEQARKAEAAKTLNPRASLRVGHHPTFVRLQFDWSVATKGEFRQEGNAATIHFDWPVDVDLYALKADLPGEIVEAASRFGPDGSDVTLTLKDGVEPRFYAETPQQFVLDIDLSSAEAARIRAEAQRVAQRAEAEAARAAEAEAQAAAQAAETAESEAPVTSGDGPRQVLPGVETVSGTVRIKFPFERDTASAVFRRGDTLWMLFDTRASINEPAASADLAAIARGFKVMSAGDTQIVRIDLSTDRLATLASEGRAWVLSIGDMLLDAPEPVRLKRTRDRDGLFGMSADLGRPYRVHSFRDPVVGDVLEVVTAFPPARGVVRDLGYVDFDALRSVHGLVLRPDNAGLEVALDKNVALISAPGGLTVSDEDGARRLDGEAGAAFRGSYVDFAAWREDNPAVFVTRREQLSAAAAEQEGQARDIARLQLAQFFVGNQFAAEAIGVLRVLDEDLRNDDLRKQVRLVTAIANVLAWRPQEAIAALSGPAFAEEVDAVMWRAIAHVEAGDFTAARADALASEGALPSYPLWIQHRFLLAGIRAALETNDLGMAQRYMGQVVFASLDPEDVSLYQLFQARIAEAQGRSAEALEGYGQVIAADIRPTRAEAVYRTMRVLKDMGRIDLDRATATLSAEAMMWRGNTLEIDMETMLAELYFDNRQYRLGFETAQRAAAHGGKNHEAEALTAEAGEQFVDLFLNGGADQLGDLDALSLYYDFRQLTPPGSRGDEMIRELARRLVKVDLLGQAADLLDYQVDSRLQGAAQAQVAADLALIRIANRQPQQALAALNRTRLSNLPPSLDRQRRILEARALIDTGRSELAIDLLERLDGLDVDLLRVDGYWRSKKYAEASGLIETIYAATAEPLAQPARLNIIKAAVGLVLTDDRLGLGRLRTKFSEVMAQSPEWALFDYITSPEVSVNGMEFKMAAKMAAGVDSITAFLTAYRTLYPADGGLLPARAAPATDA
jgi:hypothetical protein